MSREDTRDLSIDWVESSKYGVTIFRSDDPLPTPTSTDSVQGQSDLRRLIVFLSRPCIVPSTQSSIMLAQHWRALRYLQQLIDDTKSSSNSALKMTRWIRLVRELMNPSRKPGVCVPRIVLVWPQPRSQGKAKSLPGSSSWRVTQAGMVE